MATELTWGYQVQGNLSERGFLLLHHPEKQNQANRVTNLLRTVGQGLVYSGSVLVPVRNSIRYFFGSLRLQIASMMKFQCVVVYLAMVT